MKYGQRVMNIEKMGQWESNILKTKSTSQVNKKKTALLSSTEVTVMITFS